jgi:hypothetical protein
MRVDAFEHREHTIMIYLTPPKVTRPITLQGTTITPLGTTTAFGWDCTLVERPDGTVIAIVNDGLTKHEGPSCRNSTDAVAGLTQLVAWMEATAAYTLTMQSQTGSN